MSDIIEVKINEEQWTKEQLTNVGLATHHRFADWQSACNYLAVVPDADIVHMWDFGSYVKVAIIHKGAIERYRRNRILED